MFHVRDYNEQSVIPRVSLGIMDSLVSGCRSDCPALKSQTVSVCLAGGWGAYVQLEVVFPELWLAVESAGSCQAAVEWLQCVQHLGIKQKTHFRVGIMSLLNGILLHFLSSNSSTGKGSLFFEQKSAYACRAIRTFISFYNLCWICVFCLYAPLIFTFIPV